MARASVSIKALPTLMFADDYHEFVALNEQFQCIGLSLKTEELGFAENEGSYVGIVYSGRYPSKAKIKALLHKFGCTLDPEELL